MVTIEIKSTTEVSQLDSMFLEIGMKGFLIAVISNLLLIITGFSIRMRFYPWLGGVGDIQMYFLSSNIMIHGLTTLVSSLLIGIGFMGHWKTHDNPISILTSLGFFSSAVATVNWICYLPDLGYFEDRLWSLHKFEAYWPQGTFVLVLAMTMAGLALVAPWRGVSNPPKHQLIGIGISIVGILGFIPYTLIAGIYWIPISMTILIVPYLLGLIGFRVIHVPSPNRFRNFIVIAFVFTVIISGLMIVLFPV